MVLKYSVQKPSFRLSTVSTKTQTIVNTEVIRDPSSFGDIVRGLHVYGAKVLRPEALVSAFYGID